MLITMTLEATGGTTTGVRLPAEALAELGSGKRPRVRATFPNGFVLRARVGSHESVPFLAVSAATREAAGVRAGDALDIEIELDDEPEVVDVPGELANALDADPEAAAFFAGLTASQQRVFTSSVADAKKPGTRTARVTRAIDALRERRKRP